MSTHVQTPWKLSRVVITSERFKNQPLDVTSLVSNLTLFENIERPYLTGNIFILDDSGLFDGSGLYDIRGTETISVTIEGNDKSFNIMEERKFKITSIKSEAKGNDRSAVLVFTLVDEYYFNNYLKRFSKSLKGTPGKIIQNIVESEQLLNTSFYGWSSDATQSKMKVIIPYLTPLGAIEWIRDRSTTSNGSPYFTYSNLYNQGVYWRSLDDMIGGGYSINNDPYAGYFPFTNSTALVNDANERWFPEPEDQIIEEVEFTDRHNLLKLIRTGAVGSEISNLDVNKNIPDRSIYSSKIHTDTLSTNGIIPIENNKSKQNIIDDISLVDGLPIHYYQSRYFAQLSLDKVYGKYNSYYDDADRVKLRHRVESMALKNMLQTNAISCRMNVGLLFSAQSGVGDVASFVFNSNNSSNDQASGDEIIDREKSGDYLLYSISYNFTRNQKPICNVKAVKLANNYNQ